MKTSSGPRRTSVVFLLLAVLLIVPTLHCTLFQVDEHAHAHPGGVAAAASAGTSQTDHLHGTSDPADHHGDQHMTFCLEKSLLPAAGVSVLPLLWLMLIGSAVVAAVTIMFPGNAQAIRGPPRTGPPALNGQAVLTNFCISRR